MFRSCNGLDRTIFEWFIEMYKQSSKIYLIHLYGAYGFYISRLVGTLSIHVYLNTGKKNVGWKNIDACRRHAMDLHSIIYISAVQFEFSSLVFREKLNVTQTKHLSALNYK